MGSEISTIPSEYYLQYRLALKRLIYWKKLSICYIAHVILVKQCNLIVPKWKLDTQMIGARGGYTM